MELLIVIFLSGIMVLVIANIPGAINLVTSGGDESKVREVAAKKLEDIRLTGYDNLANGTTSISDSRLKSLHNVLASTVVTDCPVTVCKNSEQVKQVKITVSWSQNNEPKTYQIITLVGKGGLR